MSVSIVRRKGCATWGSESVVVPWMQGTMYYDIRVAKTPSSRLWHAAWTPRALYGYATAPRLLEGS